MSSPDFSLLEHWKTAIPDTVPLFELITHSIPYSESASTESNVYNGENNEVDDEEEIETFPCECQFDPKRAKEECACGQESNCINRELLIECSSTDCPVGIHCQNQRFQKLQYANVTVIPTGQKGHGLKTLEDLKSGGFIMEYVGEVLNKRQFKERVKLSENEPQRHFYFMTIRNGVVVDASHKGNLARFMNHSCNPNCETQKWTVNGKLRVGLFAKRPIKSGSELTFDYKFVRFGQSAQQCFCGEPNCKGTIGEEPKKEHVDLIDSDSEASDLEDIERLLDSENTLGVQDVPYLVRALLKSEGGSNCKAILAALLRSDANECYKQLLHFHGLKVLASLKISEEIQTIVLDLLLKLPITNRQQIDDSGIEEAVKKIESDLPQKTQLLDFWSSLSTEYHIPRVTSTPDLETIGLEDADDPYSLDVPEQFKRYKKHVPSIPSKVVEKRAAPRRHSRSPPPRQHTPSLPVNWHSAVSSDGQMYYYNDITKETSWEPPQSQASISLPSIDQACRIVDNSVAISRLGRPLDSRTRLLIAEDMLRQFKDASYVDLSDGRLKSSVDRFISDRLYKIQSGR